MAEKCVLVELVENDSLPKLTLDIAWPLDSEFSDLQNIASAMALKKPSVFERLAKNGSFLFQKESERFPGRFVDMGENSPVKDGSSIVCLFVPHTLVNFQNTMMEESNDSQLHQHGNHSSSDVLKANNSETSGLNFIAEDEADETIVSIAQEENTESTVSVGLSSSGTTHMTMESIVDCCYSDDAASTNTTSIYLPNRSLPGDELDTSTQAVPKGNREIDFKEYKLPTNFGHVIDEKLKNGKGLTFNETGEICRHLKNSVCLQTFKPSSDSCRKVVRMLLSKYPGSLVGDHQDEFATEQFFHSKLLSVFSRERRKNGFQLSKKGGRPRTKGSATPIDEDHSQKDLDMVSYEANVKMLLELYAKSNRSGDLQLLLKLTFEGRKYEIRNGLLKSAEEVLRKCPVLSQPAYLCDELDLLLGKNTCVDFRKRWTNLVPLIHKVANDMKSKQLISIMKQQEGDDFESESCTAMELLPMLMPTGGKSKQLDAMKYFIHVCEETADISCELKKFKRETPFILKIGNGYHVVIDGNPVLFISNSSTEALLCLMGTYYVFNIVFCKKVYPTLLFVAKQLLCQEVKEKEGKIVVQFKRLLEDARSAREDILP